MPTGSDPEGWLDGGENLGEDLNSRIYEETKEKVVDIKVVGIRIADPLFIAECLLC